MQFWFDAVNYAYATGDTEAIKANSVPDCDTCNRYIEKISAQYAAGGSFRGVHAILSNIASAPLEDFGAPISLQVEAPESQRIAADGSIEAIAQAAPPTNSTFFAAWKNDRWLAAGVVKDAS